MYKEYTIVDQLSFKLVDNIFRERMITKYIVNKKECYSLSVNTQFRTLKKRHYYIYLAASYAVSMCIYTYNVAIHRS